MSENEEELEEISFRVTVAIDVTATSPEHAAKRMDDVLKSRQPLLFSIVENDTESDPLQYIPYASDRIISTLQHFMPSCLADVVFDEESDEISVYVGSNKFRDMPTDLAREDFVASIFSALPEEELVKFNFYCYTVQEYEELFFEEEAEAEAEKEPVE